MESVDFVIKFVVFNVRYHCKLSSTLPAKNMEYFLFQRFCAILWSAQPVSELEIHTHEQILPLGELITTQQQNKGHRLKNNYFDIFRN